jgi:hypothetical protein
LIKDASLVELEELNQSVVRRKNQLDEEEIERATPTKSIKADEELKSEQK